MLSDVDNKTYEFGMLRALGFKQNSLVTLISMQSIFFSVPGLCGGLLVAYFLNIVVRYIIFSFSANSTNYQLSTTAVIIGICMGLFIPFFSNIIPIQRALGKNLRDSLDLFHRSVNELTVRIQRLQHLGLSLPQLVSAIMLIVMGILTYYLAPSAFLFQDYTLFFLIMNIILILMILGLAFISILLQPYLEVLYANAFTKCCCRRDKKLY